MADAPEVLDGPGAAVPELTLAPITTEAAPEQPAAPSPDAVVDNLAAAVANTQVSDAEAAKEAAAHVREFEKLWRHALSSEQTSAFTGICCLSV